jgi:lipopolysaccharide/colanic/teichoic acid biosynthesis glycosyltransferase
MRDHEFTNNATAARPNAQHELGSEGPMAKENERTWASARFRATPLASCLASTSYGRHGKRALDFVVSFVGLVILAIPLSVLTLAMCLLEGRPVFFQQKRVGRHGRVFTIYKFRTMRNAAGCAPTITTVGDSRVTPLGCWLRRFKLDELPQLWNVLRGDMSFVGPRPDVPGYLDRLCGDATALWELRPGITGPATLLFRREEAMLASVNDYVRFNDEVIYPEKVRVNLAYVQQISFLLDLGYILATLAPSISRRLGVDRRLGLDWEKFESRMRDAAQEYSL